MIINRRVINKRVTIKKVELLSTEEEAVERNTKAAAAASTIKRKNTPELVVTLEADTMTTNTKRAHLINSHISNNLEKMAVIAKVVVVIIKSSMKEVKPPLATRDNQRDNTMKILKRKEVQTPDGRIRNQNNSRKKVAAPLASTRKNPRNLWFTVQALVSRALAVALKEAPPKSNSRNHKATNQNRRSPKTCSISTRSMFEVDD